ncbi:MAG: DUF308 domain-containing protein [Christensenellaceae bacterium]|nr:DUF308 domain-containing protein [Christensenellaceae bacterium]
MSREIKTTVLWASVLFIIAGLVLLIWPAIAYNLICYIIGAAAVIWGLVLIGKYVFKGADRDLMDLSLIKGIIVTALGIIILRKTPDFLSIIVSVIGGIIVINSIIRLQVGLNLARMGYRSWLFVFITAVLMAVVGVLLIVDPFGSLSVITTFEGIALIVEGLVSLISIIWADNLLR